MVFPDLSQQFGYCCKHYIVALLASFYTQSYCNMGLTGSRASAQDHILTSANEVQSFQCWQFSCCIGRQIRAAYILEIFELGKGSITHLYFLTVDLPELLFCFEHIKYYLFERSVFFQSLLYDLFEISAERR